LPREGPVRECGILSRLPRARASEQTHRGEIHNREYERLNGAAKSELVLEIGSEKEQTTSDNATIVSIQRMLVAQFVLTQVVVQKPSLRSDFIHGGVRRASGKPILKLIVRDLAGSKRTQSAGKLISIATIQGHVLSVRLTDMAFSCETRTPS